MVNMYETWYNDNSNQAVRLFNEVAGKYTCFFVTQIMATLIKAGEFSAKGKNVESPCGIALHEGLQPMVERLRKKAEIRDFMASPVRSISRDSAIEEVAQKMLNDKISAFLVMDHGKAVVGIVTTDDLLKLLVKLLQKEPGRPRIALDSVMSEFSLPS